MSEQLWPLYTLAVLFGLYTLKSAIVYYWKDRT